MPVSKVNDIFLCSILINVSFCAEYCKDLNNFNSMFALVSGLGSSSVRRLKQTWTKVPNRYVKIFHDLENIMNPSQNMKNYRTLASAASSQSPMVNQ